MSTVQKVITINGAPNVGKTTVSEFIALTRPMTVAIECDVRCVGRITRRIHQPTKDAVLEKYGNTIVEDCASLTANWVGRACDVIIPAPIPEANFRELRTAIDARLDGRGVEYHCFSLRPPIEVALTDRGTRVLNDQERDLIRDMYGWLYEPAYGVVLDNQHESPEQTAATLLAQVESGASLVTLP